jgi:hypothetical protein
LAFGDLSPLDDPTMLTVIDDFSETFGRLCAAEDYMSLRASASRHWQGL